MNKASIIIAFVLFFIGCFGGIINRQNMIKFIISVEIILLSAIYVIALSTVNDQCGAGTIYAILLLPIAAIEIAIYLFVIDKDR